DPCDPPARGMRARLQERHGPRVCPRCAGCEAPVPGSTEFSDRRFSPDRSRVCSRAVSTTPKIVPSAAPGLVPLETGEGGWIARCRRTLVAMLARPGRTFDMCPEPIDHGRVLRFMAT